ncbi:unnamed protein product [Dracunculus medinensis]|uniref:HP domain-containing protein n=1 Tax=Dracunculus medinensis TaxID=318479 RepID=A0A0N4U5I0_DRAME|nr:unnamed protein product [Dracunculus medinensis]
MAEIDVSRLPSSVRERLAQLDLELSEDSKMTASPSTRAQRRHQRRLTREESRFHSEIRAEAVQQALSEYSKGKKERPNILQPIKRRGIEIRRDRTKNRLSESSSDEDSMFGSSDRSKGTPSSQSLSDRNKKISDVSRDSKNISRAPPPDVTSNAVVAEAVVRRNEKKQQKYKSSEQYEQRVWSRPSKESDQTDSPNIAGSTESTSLASDAMEA